MVFNQNHASILHFISSIIIIVGLPTGFYLMFHMLITEEDLSSKVIPRTPTFVPHYGVLTNAIDHIKYASTEIGEGFMVGLHYPSMVNHPRIILEHLRSCLASAFSQNGLNETLLNGLVKQITHTVIINAMIYPHPPLLR